MNAKTESASHKQEERRGRLVIPLFNTSFRLADRTQLRERYELMPDVWIGWLNDQERKRIADALRITEGPYYRIEFHNQTWGHDSLNPRLSVRDLTSRANHYMSLISCTIRMAPRREAAVLDSWDGSHWIREFPLGFGGGIIAGGSRRRHSYLTAERMETWAKLVQNWSNTGLDRQIYIALGYYADSIATFREHNESSLAMAAISLETLLGGDLLSDITRTLAQRGAALTARGEDAVNVYKQLKKLYHVRSKLVHEGRSPTEAQLVNIHRFLMRALPSMAALVQKSGTLKQALNLLDESLLAQRAEANYLFEAQQRWWDYVPIDSFAP